MHSKKEDAESVRAAAKKCTRDRTGPNSREKEMRRRGNDDELYEASNRAKERSERTCIATDNDSNDGMRTSVESFQKHTRMHELAKKKNKYSL